MGFKVDEVFVDFRIEFGEGENGARRINAQMAKMGKTAGVAADAQDRVARSTRKAGAATRRQTKDTKKLGQATKSMTGDLKRMIKTLIGLEVARRVIRAVLGTFVQFRQEMNNVRAITDATDRQFERLKGTALELGRTTQFTATDAARAMAFLARTGLDVNQTIAVLPGTLNLAAATAVDLATAADLSTNILKGMGLEISQLDGLVDILAKTTNSANVNIFELGEAMKIVAPVAADAGISVQKLSAMIGILGDAGIKGTLAGTALRRSILAIQTGAGTAGEALSGLGIQVEDASGNLIGLDQVLRMLEKGLVSNEDAFKIFGLRAISAAKVLAGRGADDIEKFTKALDEAGGTAERMAEQQLAGLPGAIKLTTSAAESSAIAWGDALEPALTGVAFVIRELLIPLFNGILASFELVGAAAFVVANALASAARIAFEGIVFATGGIISALGSMVRFVGELGERLDIFPGLSEGLANFGATMQRTGNQFRRGAAVDMKDAIDRVRFAWLGAGDLMEEISLRMAGVVDDTGEAAGALRGLSDAVDETVATMQRARTQLNLDVFTAQLEAVRQLLRETFGLEGEGALGLESRLEIQRQLVAMTDDQVDAATALVQAEQDLAGAVQAVLDVQRELNEAGADQEKVAQLTQELEEAVTALAAATRGADEAMEGLVDEGKDLGEVLGQIALAVRGINRLGDAFGLVNDDVRRAIDSVLDLVASFKALEAAKGALQFGTALGLAGAAAGLIVSIGGLFSESAGEKERLRVLRANTVTMEQLRISFEKSIAVLGEFTGAELGRAQELAQRQAEAFEGTTGFARALAVEELTGAERAFLEDVARTFGITLNNTAESFRALGEAIAGLDLERLTESFTGALDLLQRRFAIFDVDKPVDRLVAILDIFEEFSEIDLGKIVGLKDLDTEAGRAALEALIKTLFEEIEAGTFDIARLGGLTLEQFLDLLGAMEETLDEIAADEGVTDEGLTENFIRSTRITEVQGNELLTLARTELVVERQQLAAQLEMVGLLTAMAAIPAPAPDAMGGGAAPAAALDVGGITVEATFIITEEVDAGALVERVGTDLAVVLDRRLSELQTREDRAVGNVGRVA